MEDDGEVIGSIFENVTPGHKQKLPERDAVVNPNTAIWVDSKGRELKASDFWELSKYFNDMAKDMLQVFIQIQERFKAGALACVEMAKLLETAQKSDRDSAKVKNVFASDTPDPGPSTNKPN